MTDTASPRKPPGPSGIPLDEILRLWNDEHWTMQEIADEFSVSRQAISFRLVRAGYSPAERRAAVRNEAADNASAYREQRVETISRRVEARERARAELAALAVECDVAPYTLAHWALKAGAYSKIKGKRESVRSDSHLPPRDSPDGVALADRVIEICKPWNASHIARLILSPHFSKGGAPKKGTAAPV